MRYYESKDIKDSTHYYHFANNSYIVDTNYCDNFRWFLWLLYVEKLKDSFVSKEKSKIKCK